MKNSILLTATLVLTVLPLAAREQPKGQPQRPRQSFEEFRKGLHDDYNSFRKEILDRYDKFLDGVWVNYEQFKGEEADSRPKPRSAPKAEPGNATPSAHPLPSVPLPEDPAEKEIEPQKQTAPQPTIPTVPTLVTTKPRGDFEFLFYETPVSMPDTDVKIAMRLSQTSDYASQWRQLAKDTEVRVLMGEVEKKASEWGLNDYLKYRLISSYIDARYAGADISSRTSLKHFILANMGYGVRLGLNAHGRPLLLVPCRQQVFAKMFIRIDGKKYYVFGTEDSDPSDSRNATISTCQLPGNNNPGTDMDLRLNTLSLPYTPHSFTLSAAGLTVSGEINSAIFPVLYRYPQMPTADFARSSVCPDVRDQIVSQLKTQLEGKDEREAVDTLLKFVQEAFEYATDGDYHGFEKPYFFEETLFYPKCDCEDRAIFYTYLLWNVLGLENHLINYPGHESASVKLTTPITGDAYEHQGAYFYISDPTFIGSRTGMCMPAYLTETPAIDLYYK
ncbi:MAG: hypothetical protein K2I12_08825 [Duncaniella sp.]|nr:hypothetical protein [Duncaniella sp.]